MPLDEKRAALAEGLLQRFVLYMRSNGYKFEWKTVSGYRRLVFFLAERIDLESPVVTAEVTFDWVENGGKGTRKSAETRASRIRTFSRYLVRCGAVESFILPPKMGPSGSRDFVPYIFTRAEIEEVTRAFDAMPERDWSPLRHIVFPAMFRAIYGCGLRLGEATGLVVGDVDLDGGVLTVRNSKNGDSRYVPMSQSLTECLEAYIDRIDPPSRSSADPLFPSPRGGSYCNQAVLAAFQQAYAVAGVVNQKGNPPRVHDLRHTFAVHSLQAAVERGESADVFLPALSAYMGHRHVKSAEYYLHLTQEGQDHLIEKMMGSYEFLYGEVDLDAWI